VGRVRDAEDVAEVVDDPVLKTATGTEERDVSLAGPVTGWYAAPSSAYKPDPIEPAQV
jgi:hypothetical protein